MGRRLGGLQSHFGHFEEKTDLFLCHNLIFRSSSQVTAGYAVMSPPNSYKENGEQVLIF
jgi:hypothetical protein